MQAGWTGCAAPAYRAAHGGHSSLAFSDARRHIGDRLLHHVRRPRRRDLTRSVHACPATLGSAAGECGKRHLSAQEIHTGSAFEIRATRTFTIGANPGGGKAGPSLSVRPCMGCIDRGREAPIGGSRTDVLAAPKLKPRSPAAGLEDSRTRSMLVEPAPLLSGNDQSVPAFGGYVWYSAPASTMSASALHVEHHACL